MCVGKATALAIVGARIRCDRLGRGWTFERRDGQALRTRFVWWSALPMLAAAPAVAATQPAAPAPAPVASPTPTEESVEFTADQVIYDSDAEIVTAMAGQPFVFNLGHGIVPETPPENVGRVVELVRSAGSGR